MHVYATPMSCSFALHVALLECESPFTIDWVVRRTKRLEDGRDYLALAPKGIVPAVVLGDGTLLTETAAVLQLAADQAPDKHLAPAWGSPERYRLIEWLNFVASEIHAKGLAPIFDLRASEGAKSDARAALTRSLAFTAEVLAARDVLVGEHFTVADAYLFWAVLAARFGGTSLDAWPALTAYLKRHQERPSVARAMAIEVPLFMAASKAA